MVHDVDILGSVQIPLGWALMLEFGIDMTLSFPEDIS